MAGLLASSVCALLWWWLRPDLLNYESYFYAAGIEGFLDVSALYNVFVPEIHMPDFSRYHPNHPLPHALVYGLRESLMLAGVVIPAVDVMRGMNFLASVFAVYLFFRIAEIITADRTLAFLFALVAGFSPVFWFSAVSGESYPMAYLLMVLVFLQMLKEYQDESLSFTLRKAFLFSLAFSFHFGVALFAIPIVIWYVASGIRRRSLRPLKSIFVYGIFCLAVFCLVYPLMFMWLFGISSLSHWFAIFTMQSRIPMGGQFAPAEAGLLAATSTFLDVVGSGFLAGEGVFQRIARIHILIGLALSIFVLLKLAQRRAFAAAHAGWLIVPSFFLMLVMRSPTNLTYSLMIMLPAFLAILLLVRTLFTKRSGRIILLVWLAITYTSSMLTVILPKSGLNESTVFFSASIPGKLLQEKPLVALVHNYYGIVPDLYYLGNRHKVKPTALYFHYDQTFPDRLLQDIRNSGDILLLTDRLMEHEKIWLQKEKIQISELFFRSELHSPQMYWFSTRPRFSVAAGYRRELALIRLKVM